MSLENSIRHSIVTEDGRSVSSVDCTPHRKDVTYSDGIVHLQCVARFTDGTSFATAATIEARSYQFSGWNFTFDTPGPLHDITTAPLPRPSAVVAADSPTSLFYANNLRPVVVALAGRFATNQYVLAAALYPGALEAVIGSDGQAQLVTAHADGALSVGPRTRFSGQRSGIAISQLKAAVPERLARLIAGRAHVPMRRLDRFVLGSEGDLATWEIFPTSGPVRFRSHIMGDALEAISGGHRRQLN